MHTPYRPLRPSSPMFVPVRGLRYHVHTWGDITQATAERPPLVLVHGWMDVGASYQFVVDELARLEGHARFVIAPDWRGFGLTEAPASDAYWFPDYLGDLDALIDALCPGTAIDLVGHSMGGNVVMGYAGARPQRVRRLVNLEGFGLPKTAPEQAPRRMAQWLDDLKTPQTLRDYASEEDVAQRLLANDPLLSAERAAWLAPHWSRRGEDGRWHILGDPAHKRTNPVLYRVDETLETWRQITAPLLWVEGDLTDIAKWWGQRYSKAEFHERLGVVRQVRRETIASAGHMLHHDQPAALARLLRDFLA